MWARCCTKVPHARCPGVCARGVHQMRDTRHYDTLGIYPTATQAEIKAAYYKLSMEFHPDRNQGCETSANRFRLVTEAYEVLGSFGSRVRYDRGLAPQPRHERREDAGSGAGKPVTRGRNPGIYDFDEWTRSHYSSMFERKAEERRGFARSQSAKRRKYNADAALMQGVVVVLSVAAVAIASAFLAR